MTSPISGFLPFRILPLLLALFLLNNLPAQDTAIDPDRAYGLDQSLVNGRRLAYHPPPGTEGHPYLQTSLFTTGTVLLSGSVYPGRDINYDIHRQQLLLRYADDQSPFNVIEVSKARLTGFIMGNRRFELLFPFSDTCFYQVIGNGRIRFAYLWSKKLELSTTAGNSAYHFLKPSRSMFLLKEGKIHGFRSNRGLVKLFSREHQPAITDYLRQHRLRVKKSPDAVMESLAGFLATLE